MKPARRRVLGWAPGLPAAPTAPGACAVGFEPFFELAVTHRVALSLSGHTH